MARIGILVSFVPAEPSDDAADTRPVAGTIIAEVQVERYSLPVKFVTDSMRVVDSRSALAGATRLVTAPPSF